MHVLRTINLSQIRISMRIIALEKNRQRSRVQRLSAITTLITRISATHTPRELRNMHHLDQPQADGHEANHRATKPRHNQRGRPLQHDQDPRPTQTSVPPPICAKKKSAGGRQGPGRPREGVAEKAPAMMYIAPRRLTPRATADTDSSHTNGTPRATRRCLQGGNAAMTPPSPGP